MKQVHGVNVTPGECTICGNKGDTVQADCHVLYKGEWINQVEPVCPAHVAKLVPEKKEKKEESQPAKKAKTKLISEVKESVREYNDFSDKHAKR